MDFPVDMFLKPVPDTEDMYAFTVGGKALGDDSVSVEENGDLIIEGYAAVWEGVDRQGENFAEGAFQRGIKAFLGAGGPLCFHHKRDHVLGAVTDLTEDDKGLKFRARVDGEIQKDPKLAAIYHQVKKGTLKGVSVGGFFRRAIVAGKQKIADMDFTEISVTGVPMHTGPSFSVVAGKALSDMPTVPDVITEGGIREEDERQINWLLEELDGLFTRITENVNKRTESASA